MQNAKWVLQQTFIENRIKKKETKQIVVLRDFLIMRLEGLSKSKGDPKGSSTILPNTRKSGWKDSGIQEKIGLFMKFTTQKQLFAKLKQLKQV